MNENTDIVFSDEEKDALSEIAHVDFDLLDTNGRWLLKVLSGPNTGAEFSMQGGSSYILGTDSQQCDIIFQDLSVSRQHAKISVDNRDNAIIEDLGSRNGTFIDGEKITQTPITGNVLVSIGTTTFLLIDREAERTTIVAPRLYASLHDNGSMTVGGEPVDGSLGPQPLPSSPETNNSSLGLDPTGQQISQESLNAQSEPQKDLREIHEAVLAPLQSEVDRVKEEEKRQAKLTQATSSLIVLAVITAIILIIGVGTTTLFHTEDVQAPKVLDPEKEIAQRLNDFPAIRYSYNPVNNRLLLIGHVLTSVDRSRMLDSLQQLKFLTNIDYSNVVIDELVYREINQILAKNPAWRSIAISSPSAGKYVLSGFLKTKEQADELYDYISQNFTYVDLLEKRVIVEEDVLGQITRALNSAGLRSIQPSLNGGELTLRGALPGKDKERFSQLVASFKSINGIRSVQILVDETGQAAAYIDLSSKYVTTGFSQQGSSVSVVINGRILSTGDTIDGMTITSITPSTVYLEKGGVKYKIDFNR